MELKEGDIVKIVGTTMCGNSKHAECIKIGSLCKVVEVAKEDVEDDEYRHTKYYGVVKIRSIFPLVCDSGMYYYTREALEKGELQWIPSGGNYS